jgi:hypothetical protein
MVNHCNHPVGFSQLEILVNFTCGKGIKLVAVNVSFRRFPTGSAKIFFTHDPGKFRRNLRLCTRFKPFGVNVHFRRFLSGHPTQQEIKENFMCVYGNRNLGCENKISSISDWE